MALRNIVIDGDPILLKKSRVVEKFDDRLHMLIDDMIETMRDAEGVGLAAVQVGVLRRVIVIEIDDKLYEVVNPEITFASDDIECSPEGCLSFPGESAVVPRPYRVTVKGQDRHGNDIELEGEGFLAKAFCHEIDHLNGIVFLDKALEGEELDKWLEEQEELFEDDEE